MVYFVHNIHKKAQTEFDVPHNISGALKYYYGTDLKYIGIKVNLSIDPNNLGFPDGIPIRDDWQTYVSDLVSILRGLFTFFDRQMSDGRFWHYYTLDSNHHCREIVSQAKHKCSIKKTGKSPLNSLSQQ